MYSFEFYLDADIGERRVVARGERVEMFGVVLRRSVAPEQLVLEEDANLRHARLAVLVLGRRYLNGRDEVLTPVAPHHPHRQLRTGEHYRLAEVLEHETQRRRAVCHRVGTMQHDETVVFLVVLFNLLGQRDPEVGSHVRRVDEMLERIEIDAVVKVAQHRQMLVDVAEVERHETTCLRVFHHPNRAARI